MELSDLSTEQLESLKRLYYKKTLIDDHKCDSKGAKLMRCCEEWRCSVCHVRHLNSSKHSPGAVMIFFKGYAPQTPKPDSSIPLPNKQREKEKLEDKLNILLHKMSPEQRKDLKRRLMDMLTD